MGRTTPDRGHLQGCDLSCILVAGDRDYSILLPAIIVIGAGYYLLVRRKKK